MAINYAEKDSGLFDQKLSQGVLTQPLETPNVNWLDAQSFKVTTLSTSGYKNHSRGGTWNRGTYANPQEIYTLNFDRDIEFFVDKADVDETAGQLSALNISRIFIEEHAQPEVDAYRFAKLAQFAINNGHSAVETITPSTIYARLKAAIKPMRKYGPGNLIAYLDSSAMDALERSTEFQRTISVQNVGESALESRITSLDGVRLVEVWDIARFGSKFDFEEGFVLADDGAPLNFLIVAMPAILCKAKFNSIYLYEPGSVGQGDGYLYQNRLYHDIFVLENQTDAVYVSLQEATPPTP